MLFIDQPEDDVMGDNNRENLTVEGEPSKRYGVAYGGEIIGSYDTAKEAWEAYRKYDDLIRSVVDRKKKYRYSFRDGRKEISIEQFRKAVKAEG